MSSEEMTARFLRMSTPLVADATIRLGLPAKIAPSGIRPLVAGSKLAGRASPVVLNGYADRVLEGIYRSTGGEVLVLSVGLRPALVGLGSGLIMALLSTRWLSTLLFGVSPVDPITFGAVTLVLGVGALFACYLPARKAAWVDPVLALRQD